MTTPEEIRFESMQIDNFYPGTAYRMRCWANQFGTLQEELARAREALKFYADKDSWSYADAPDGETDATRDAGRRARAALGESSGGTMESGGGE